MSETAGDILAPRVDPAAQLKSHRPLAQVALGNPIFPLLAVMLVAFAVLVPNFATLGNIKDLAAESCALLLLAGGGAVVLISGNFDLSSEGTMTFTAVFGAWLMQKGSPGGPFGLTPAIVVPLMILFGVTVGLVNGVLVTRFEVNPFIVTLTMLLTLKGAAAIPGNAATFIQFPPSYLWPGVHTIDGVSMIVIISVALFVLLALYMRLSVFGRHVYAVGGDKKAAIESGISSTRVIVAAYVISGALASIAGWMEVTRVGSAQALLDDGIIFDVFAAMVIGGIALTGGKGRMLGVAGGVVLMSSINNVLNLVSLNTLWVDFVRGLTLFVAIGLIIVRQTLSGRLGIQERASG